MEGLQPVDVSPGANGDDSNRGSDENRCDASSWKDFSKQVESALLQNLTRTQVRPTILKSFVKKSKIAMGIHTSPENTQPDTPPYQLDAPDPCVGEGGQREDARDPYDAENGYDEKDPASDDRDTDEVGIQLADLYDSTS